MGGRFLGGAGFFDTSLPTAGDLDRDIAGNPRARKDRHTAKSEKDSKPKSLNRRPPRKKNLPLNGVNGSHTGTDDVDSVIKCPVPNNLCWEEKHLHKKKPTGKAPLTAAARRHLERAQKEGHKAKTSQFTTCPIPTRDCLLEHYHSFRDDGKADAPAVDGEVVAPARVAPIMVVEQNSALPEKVAPEPVVPPKGEQAVQKLSADESKAVVESKFASVTNHAVILPVQAAPLVGITFGSFDAKVGEVHVEDEHKHDQVAGQPIDGEHCRFVDQYIQRLCEATAPAPLLRTPSAPSAQEIGIDVPSNRAEDVTLCTFTIEGPKSEYARHFERVQSQRPNEDAVHEVYHRHHGATGMLGRLSRQADAERALTPRMRWWRRLLHSRPTRPPPARPDPTPLCGPEIPNHPTRKVIIYCKTGVVRDHGFWGDIKKAVVSALPFVRNSERLLTNPETNIERSGVRAITPATQTGQVFSFLSRNAHRVTPFRTDSNLPADMRLVGLGYDSMMEVTIFEDLLAYLRSWSDEEGKRLQRRRPINRVSDSEFEMNIGFIDAVWAYYASWPHADQAWSTHSGVAQDTILYYIQSRMIDARLIMICTPATHRSGFSGCGSSIGNPSPDGPFRLGTVPCVIEEDFVYNEEFELLNKGTPQYFVDGEVKFPPGESRDGTYRTKFGGASCNYTIYCDCNACFTLAMRRLTGKRLPKEPGAHERLQRSQEQWFAQNQEIIAHLRTKYARHFEDYKGSEEECREHHADPHIKRALRIQGFKELDESAALPELRNPWVRSVWWKMKKNEYAKPGKKPRGICDLGVTASLRGAWLTNFLKCAQAAEDLEIEGGRFTFCKSPDPFELEKHFRNLIDPPGRFYFVYFSDDSCLSIRTPEGVKLYNLDISSCDASHGAALFQALIDLMPTPETRRDMEILVEQCKLPLRVVDCNDKRNVVFLKPKGPKLLSGSTITTAINNLANLAIGLEIVRSYTIAPDDVENPSMVAAAARVGYILTGCKPLKGPHQLQFLKHSPVRDDTGQWRPMLNVGVLVRASMTCNGDLPGRGPIINRALAFQRGLLQGAYPYISTHFLDLMKASVGEGHTVEVDFTDKTLDNEKYPRVRIPCEEIRARYDLDELEYQGLLQFAKLKIFEVLHNEGISKILKCDYGLETVEAGVIPVVDRDRWTDGTLVQ